MRAARYAAPKAQAVEAFWSTLHHHAFETKLLLAVPAMLGVRPYTAACESCRGSMLAREALAHLVSIKYGCTDLQIGMLMMVFAEKEMSRQREEVRRLPASGTMKAKTGTNATRAESKNRQAALVDAWRARADALPQSPHERARKDAIRGHLLALAAVHKLPGLEPTARSTALSFGQFSKDENASQEGSEAQQASVEPSRRSTSSLEELVLRPRLRTPSTDSANMGAARHRVLSPSCIPCNDHIDPRSCDDDIPEPHRYGSDRA